MRLSQEAIRIIRDTTKEVFGSGSRVLLFGSRVHDDRQGGDIDLLVESQTPIQDLLGKQLELVAKLQLRLGDQPIDVLVLDPGTPRRAVHEEALRTGIPL